MSRIPPPGSLPKLPDDIFNFEKAERSRQGRRNKRFGTARENEVKKLLIKEGWYPVRATGSLGVADFLAIRKSYVPHLVEARLIEVKSSAKGAFADFPPKDRDELVAAADAFGATAMLVWWPPGGEPVWIASKDFPRRRRRG
jgi:Holliday junction resolvase